MGRHRADTAAIPRVDDRPRRRRVSEFVRRWFRGDEIAWVRYAADPDQRPAPADGGQDHSNHPAESELLVGGARGNLRPDQEDVLRRVGEFSEVVLERYIALSQFVQAKGLEEEFEKWSETSRSRVS